MGHTVGLLQGVRGLKVLFLNLWNGYRIFDYKVSLGYMFILWFFWICFLVCKFKNSSNFDVHVLTNNTSPSVYQKEDWILNGITKQVNQHLQLTSFDLLSDKTKPTY